MTFKNTCHHGYELEKLENAQQGSSMVAQYLNITKSPPVFPQKFPRYKRPGRTAQTIAKTIPAKNLTSWEMFGFLTLKMVVEVRSSSKV